jgi:hypothetical protein
MWCEEGGRERERVNVNSVMKQEERKCRLCHERRREKCRIVMM